MGLSCWLNPTKSKLHLLHKRQDIEGTHHRESPVSPVGPQGEDEVGWKTYTSTLEAQVFEPQEKKTSTNRDSSRKVAA